MIGSFGLWTSIKCTTERISDSGRKPRLAARGEEPSRMMAARRSRRVCHSGDRGVPGGATKISESSDVPGKCPAAERMELQEPAGAAGTKNVPANPGATASSRMSRLFRECIPDARAKIDKIRAARIAFIPQIHTAYDSERDCHRWRCARRVEAEARHGFGEVGPVLLLRVKGEVVGPEGLDFEAADG